MIRASLRGLALQVAAIGLFSAAGLAGEAAANAPIGSVVAMRGEVQAIDSAGQTRPLAAKAPLFLADTVKTGEVGRVQLRLNDNTLISLGPKSDMKLAEYKYDAQAQSGQFTGSVTNGVFRVMGGAITKIAPDKFKTETPAATIGIRGSMFQGHFSAKSQKLVTAFLGGTGIYVANPQGTVEITQPSYGTTVGAGQAPAQPVFFNTKMMGLLGSAIDGEGPANENFDADFNQATQEGGGEQGNQGGQGGPGGQGAQGGEPVGQGGQGGGDQGGDNQGGGNPDDLANQAEGILADSNQQSTDNQVSEQLTGSYVFATGDVLRVRTGTDGDWQYDWLDGSPVNDGVASLRGIDKDELGLGLSWTFTLAGAKSSGSYSGFFAAPYTRAGAGETLTDAAYFYDDLGQFVYFAGDNDYNLAELGYAGKPTLTAMPTDGVDMYLFGDILIETDQGAAVNAVLTDLYGGINYRNGRALFIFSDFDDDGTDLLGSAPRAGYIVGTQNGNALWEYSAFLATGRDLDQNGSAVWDGEMTWGTIYGQDRQGVGFTADGELLSVADEELGHFKSTGAAFKAWDYSKSVAPTGTLQVTGLASGWNVMPTSTGWTFGSFWKASDAGGNLTATFDRDAGTITAGGFSLASSDYSASLKLGTDYDEAVYIADNLWADTLDANHSTVTDSAGTATIMENGSYIVTAPASVQVSTEPWAVWGEWGFYHEGGAAAASTASGAGTANTVAGTSLLQEAQGFWVAGVKTDVSDLLMRSGTGVYTGVSYARELDSLTGKITNLTGTSSFAFSFAGANTKATDIRTDYGNVKMEFNGASSTGLLNNVNSFTADVSQITRGGQTFSGANVAGGGTGAWFGPGGSQVGFTFGAQAGGQFNYNGVAVAKE